MFDDFQDKRKITFLRLLRNENANNANVDERNRQIEIDRNKEIN